MFETSKSCSCMVFFGYFLIYFSCYTDREMITDGKMSYKTVCYIFLVSGIYIYSINVDIVSVIRVGSDTS